MRTPVSYVQLKSSLLNHHLYIAHLVVLELKEMQCFTPLEQVILAITSVFLATMRLVETLLMLMELIFQRQEWRKRKTTRKLKNGYAYGNFNPFTYEWVDLSFVLSETGKMGQMG